VIKIGNLTARRGEKVKGFLKVYETGIELPVTIICGKEEGETLLLTSGIHCAEYSGIEAAIELAQELEAEEISGNIIIVHPVNISGFLACNHNSNVPEDNQNLNRMFPGNEKGSVSEQIAHYIVKELHRKADYYIDMHGGSIQEELTPYVYYVTAAKAEVAAMAKNMACGVNTVYMVGSKVGSQGSYNHAGSAGIPSILIERGCSGVWSREEVEIYKADIINIMRRIGIMQDGKAGKSYHPINIENVDYYEAKFTGLWYPEKKAGNIVKKGELAGTIKDFFGTILERIYSRNDAVILYQICSLSVLKGSELLVNGILIREEGIRQR
jgi:predicted deacylase